MGPLPSADSGWLGVPWPWWALGAMLLMLGVFGVLNGLTNKIYRPVDGLVQGVVGRMGSGKSLFVVSRVLLPFCSAVSKRGGSIPSTTGRPMRRAITNFRFDPGEGVECEIRNVQPTHEVSIFRSLLDLADEIGAVEGPWLDDKGVMHPGTDPIPDDAESRPLYGDTWSYERQPILNGLVVLDELHFFANSNAVALGNEASYFISMARKLNAEVWWCSQHEMKVHKRIRDESSSLWLAGKLNGFLGWFADIGAPIHVCREYHSPALLTQARDAAGTSRAPRASDKRVYRFTKRTLHFYNSFELLMADPDPSVVRRAARRRSVGPNGASSDPVPPWVSPNSDPAETDNQLGPSSEEFHSNAERASSCNAEATAV